MIEVVPDPVTNSLVTSIVSTVESSEDFLMVIFPVSTSTASENRRTISLVVAIPVASSTGVEVSDLTSRDSKCHFVSVP